MSTIRRQIAPLPKAFKSQATYNVPIWIAGYRLVSEVGISPLAVRPLGLGYLLPQMAMTSLRTRGHGSVKDGRLAQSPAGFAIGTAKLPFVKHGPRRRSIRIGSTLEGRSRTTGEKSAAAVKSAPNLASSVCISRPLRCGSRPLKV